MIKEVRFVRTPKPIGRQLRITAILADFHERQAELITEEAVKKREEAEITLVKLGDLDDVLEEMMDSMLCKRLSPWRRA